MKLGIVCAMEEELNSVSKYLCDKREIKLFDLSFSIGNICGMECVLVLCGIGKVNAARSTQILIDNFKVDYIINIGVGAGVNPILNIGDIVISKSLVQHDFDITAFNHPKGFISGVGLNIMADDYLIDCYLKSNIDDKVYVEVIASGDIFVTSPKMSEKIKNKFNAFVVEMEGASVAQVAYLSHVPFLVIRSISDIPNNDNNIDFDEFLTSSSEKVSKTLVRMISLMSDELKKNN